MWNNFTVVDLIKIKRKYRLSFDCFFYLLFLIYTILAVLPVLVQGVVTCWDFSDVEIFSSTWVFKSFVLLIVI